MGWTWKNPCENKHIQKKWMSEKREKMIHPIHALLYTGILTLFMMVVLWPRYGLLSRWRRLMRQSKRSYLEDALKHIYECERSRIPCTLISIERNFNIQLIAWLKKLKPAIPI